MKINHLQRMKNALDKFDPKEAERVLDILSDEEDKGYQLSDKESSMRDRLWKCLEAYERTMYYIEK